MSAAEKTPIDVKWVQDKKDRDAKYVETGFKVVVRAAGKGEHAGLTHDRWSLSDHSDVADDKPGEETETSGSPGWGGRS